MKITALGCGNAFSTLNGNNSFLLEDIDKSNSFNNEGVLFQGRKETWEGIPRKMLIDCGWAMPHMLQKAQISVKDITDVYVSHAHADHIGGLEFLAFSRYDFVNKPQFAPNGSPCLIGNSSLLKDVWEKSLRGGMESLEGLDCTLETFFKVKAIEPHKHFEWCGWDIRLVQQIHIMTGSMITNTFGIIMKKEGHKTVYFVTDSQHCSPHQAEVFYKEADLIFQDMEALGVDVVDKTMKFCSHVHANYGQLAGYKNSNSPILPDNVKAKMYLTHYQDFVSDDKDFYGNACEWEKMVITDGFAGLMTVGKIFEI